jgi:hypothetical protein
MARHAPNRLASAFEALVVLVGQTWRRMARFSRPRTAIVQSGGNS